MMVRHGVSERRTAAKEGKGNERACVHARGLPSHFQSTLFSVATQRRRKATLKPSCFTWRAVEGVEVHTDERERDRKAAQSLPFACIGFTSVAG